MKAVAPPVEVDSAVGAGDSVVGGYNKDCLYHRTG
jgi:fructose-1-phosphate kinase PfkB-like protein